MKQNDTSITVMFVQWFFFMNLYLCDAISCVKD